MPYYVALSKGIHPKDLGLSGTNADCAYVQCLDPCEITGGGMVVFEIFNRVNRAGARSSAMELRPGSTSVELLPVAEHHFDGTSVKIELF